MADDIKIEIVGDELAGYSATLPTGQVYKGASKDILLNELVKAQVNSSMTLKEKETQLADVRREQERLDQERQRKARGEEGQEQTFDREAFNKEYWRLINTDPLAAIELANSVYYGVDDPRGAFKKSVTVADFVSDAVATREFLKDNEDFPANKENGERLVEETLNAGLELTSVNLERTWKNLKREGTIAPLTTEQMADEKERLNVSTETGVPKRRTPPPVPGGETRGGPTDAAVVAEESQLDNFATMTRAQREEILRKKGMM
jgi:hypothetical protein